LDDLILSDEGGHIMPVIDVDSHVTVTKRLEDSAFAIKLLPDGSHLMEFDGHRFDVIAPNGKSQRPHKPPIDICVTWDLNRRLEDLDRDGIDRQVLIFHTSHVFYGAELSVAVQAARGYNDGLAEMIATCKQPTRYLGAAPLPLQDPTAAAAETVRAVKELKMPTIVIGTNVRGKNLDLPEFWPFFAQVNELEIPIIVHSDGLTPFQTHPAAGERTGWWERVPFAADQPIWWMLTHPFEHMIVIARLVFSGLLDRYPNLKFIFEEGNVGYALYLFDRLEEGWEFGELIHGARVHMRGPKKHPLEYLHHFHWAVESEDSLIGEAVKRWGADRILFSSDYPHPDSPWPESVKGMKAALAGCSETDVLKVLGGNAAELLHL
jgi:aminocarboxymuconate-semialdehyde decarboxylase